MKCHVLECNVIWYEYDVNILEISMIQIYIILYIMNLCKHNINTDM